MFQSNWKPWGDHPIVVSILLISAVISLFPAATGIIAFFTDKEKKPLIQVQPESQSNNKSQTSKPSKPSLLGRPMPVTWEPTFSGAKDIVSDLGWAQATSPGISAENEMAQAKRLYASKDYTAALPLFTRAANAGNEEAMVLLGEMYYKGMGVPQDYRKAQQWWEKAAARGDAGAMHNLGELYEKGLGVPQDYNEQARYRQARQWYETGADKGNAWAMYNLGMLYEKGLGVPQNFNQARQWYEKAAAQGHDYAKTRLQQLRK